MFITEPSLKPTVFSLENIPLLYGVDSNISLSLVLGTRELVSANTTITGKTGFALYVF